MYPCGRTIQLPITRRQMLNRCANGFGAVALSTLLADERKASAAGAAIRQTNLNPFSPRKPHFPAKARNIIFLYMDGGPSQVDTFDPKPLLDSQNGKPFALDIDTRTLQFNNKGNTQFLEVQAIRRKRDPGQRFISVHWPACR